MFYFNTNKPQSIFFCRIPVVLESHRLSRGGGGVAHPLHPPPRSAPACNATYRTGLHDNNMTVDSEIPSIISQHGMRNQYLKRMHQSPVEVSILPHPFSHCYRPLLAGRLITVFRSQKLHLSRGSQTQTYFCLHTVNFKLLC